MARHVWGGGGVTRRPKSTGTGTGIKMGIILYDPYCGGHYTATASLARPFRNADSEEGRIGDQHTRSETGKHTGVVTSSPGPSRGRGFIGP
jgi:hypothetical protein